MKSADPRRGSPIRSRLGPESRFWALTSYFNPAGWQMRRRNYGIFRRHLELPLLTVELAFGGRAELTPDDAEIYLRLDEGDVMWQKERLLNLGFAALPEHVTHVAWLDCDIVLERPGWWREALAELRRCAAIQVFDSVVHLAPLADDSDLYGAECRSVARETAFAAWPHRRRMRRGDSLRLPARHRPSRGSDPLAKGVGWAARRELVAEFGLYDRAIVGGGDSAALAAFIGDAEGYLEGSTPKRRRFLGDAYRAWASRAETAVGGKVGSIAGRALHLWHGHLAHRAYASRFDLLEVHDFDAEADLRLGVQGAWLWASCKPELWRAVADYFGSRREDERSSAFAEAPGAVPARSELALSGV